ncbi:MAG: FMN-binding protein [bacterium]|jgi:major membrane immunogen (membrane-anchored lipoprotein)
MRKVLVLLLLALLVIAVPLGGCLRQPQESPPPAKETPKETPPTDNGKYEDGTYTGETEFDDRGWKGVVEIVVTGGEIVEVDYDEVDKEGNAKSEDEKYNENWEAQAGISAGEAYPAYEEELIEKQHIEGVDVITGATGTHEKFTEAVKNALKDMEE